MLDFAPFSKDEIMNLIETAIDFKRKGYPHDLFKGKCVAAIFEKPSTRTRIALNAAVSRLGGTTINLQTSEMQLSRGEPLKDTAKVLSRYVDAIVARMNRHKVLEELASYSTIPVINALTDLHHPTQALADLMTICEYAGDLKGVKLAYIGDGNNVCNSLLQIVSKVGLNIAIATPPEYSVRDEIVREALIWASQSGAKIELLNDPIAAVRDADFVYTDVFVSMGSEEERDRRLRVFLPKYQVNASLLSYAKPNVKFMHCMPMVRGEEVTEEVADGPMSIIYDQAENRMHTFAAVLKFLLMG